MKTNWRLERNIPLLFLLVTLAAYGLLLPLTGFYWDDLALRLDGKIPWSSGIHSRRLQGSVHF